jgi:hypothetical protein
LAEHFDIVMDWRAYAAASALLMPVPRRAGNTLRNVPLRESGRAARSLRGGSDLRLYCEVLRADCSNWPVIVPA